MQLTSWPGKTQVAGGRQKWRSCWEWQSCELMTSSHPDPGTVWAVSLNYALLSSRCASLSSCPVLSPGHYIDKALWNRQLLTEHDICTANIWKKRRRRRLRTIRKCHWYSAQACFGDTNLLFIYFEVIKFVKMIQLKLNKIICLDLMLEELRVSQKFTGYSQR